MLRCEASVCLIFTRSTPRITGLCVWLSVCLRVMYSTVTVFSFSRSYGSRRCSGAWRKMIFSVWVLCRVLCWVFCVSHLFNACCVSYPSDCHWFRRSCDTGTLFYVATIAVDPFIAVPLTTQPNTYTRGGLEVRSDNRCLSNKIIMPYIVNITKFEDTDYAVLSGIVVISVACLLPVRKALHVRSRPGDQLVCLKRVVVFIGCFQERA